MSALLIAQITDCHLKVGRKLAYGLVDAAGFLEKAVAHVNAFSPPIAAVIATGDLADMGRAEDYGALRPILDQLRCPYYVVPGNHDDARTMREAFRDHAYLPTDGEALNYAVDHGQIRLIGLDSSRRGEPHGLLGPERLRWLDDALSEAPKQPTLLFLHHPPFVTGIRHMDVQNLFDAEALFSVLSRHSQVRHVACGHVHRPIETTIAGIGVSIGPNSAHVVTLDLHPEGPSTFTLEPPAIRLFRITEDGQVVTHLSFIGTFVGPHPFFEPGGALID